MKLTGNKTLRVCVVYYQFECRDHGASATRCYANNNSYCVS